jgi:hypothetical protein
LFGLSIAVADRVGAGVKLQRLGKLGNKKRETNKIEHVFATNAQAK